MKIEKTPEQKRVRIKDNSVAGYNYILRFQLLRAGLEQRRVSQVGRTPAGHAFRAVHGSHRKDEETDFQTENRAGRVVRYSRVTRSYRHKSYKTGE